MLVRGLLVTLRVCSYLSGRLYTTHISRTPFSVSVGVHGVGVELLRGWVSEGVKIFGWLHQVWVLLDEIGLS
jgi:hypothetical protein